MSYYTIVLVDLWNEFQKMTSDTERSPQALPLSYVQDSVQLILRYLTLHCFSLAFNIWLRLVSTVPVATPCIKAVSRFITQF